MRKNVAMLCLLAGACVAPVLAAEGPTPKGVSHLDHVFLIMMENHGYGQIIGNPYAPYTNQLAASANSATNYFAVAHPSLTNYLEVVGGSNFGIHADEYPDWDNPACSPNLATGVTATDSPASPPSGLICPIAGDGIDAATPALDTSTNETDTPPLTNIDGIASFPADPNITGMTIADQLVAAGRSWKTYQESLPIEGADGINYSDGFYSNKTDFSTFPVVFPSAFAQSDVVKLYAVKHNPFAYFANVQAGDDPRLSLRRVVGFDGLHGLYADLATGNVPDFSFIAPNQCNDQHGRSEALVKVCLGDPSDAGTIAGLNPALIQRGDLMLERLVDSIEGSPAWKHGRNAIVILWDENDYSSAPNINQVPLLVVQNQGPQGVKSATFYTHFSLLKSLEAGFELPCLNHACDATAPVMTDLFGDERHGHGK